MPHAPRASVGALRAWLAPERVLHVRVNGQSVERRGGTVFDALRDAGVPAARECLAAPPDGACAECLVEIGGALGPVSACATPLEDGMEIRTGGPRVERARARIRALTGPGARSRPYDPALVDDTHPYLRVDLNRCVQCLRCVRACEAEHGVPVWRFVRAGGRGRIVPDGPSLLASSCDACGACALECPTGAIQDRSVAERGRPLSWARVVCDGCGQACELHAGARCGEIVQTRLAHDGIRPGGPRACAAGRFEWPFAPAASRAPAGDRRHAVA